MNDLIAVNAGDLFHTYEALANDPWSIGDNIAGVGPLRNYVGDLASGDWAGAVWNGALTVAAVASWAIDPFGTLLSSAAGFLMDYMPPLPMMLDALAGNPAMVEGISATWSNVAGRLSEVAAALETELAQLMARWTGPAALAYEAYMRTVITVIKAEGIAAVGIGAGMAIASVIVAIVREITKQIIADLVGRLIAYIIETGATLGVALPIVIGQAVTAITNTILLVTDWSGKLVRCAEQGMELMTMIGDALGQLQAAISVIQSGVNQGQSAAGG
ncbi:WXG100 family type VII secretion target [Occultella gossypii]|uniref:Uncharacterized protein n=1 Tax=Occultella gossypii TaxID=2800820 RepID=A0ABS7S828_9MICO|nr:hypothetical protein [Occultella gossypii]MBZ2196506.1 hypothetical protein [Occultella gossypii]